MIRDYPKGGRGSNFRCLRILNTIHHDIEGSRSTSILYLNKTWPSNVTEYIGENYTTYNYVPHKRIHYMKVYIRIWRKREKKETRIQTQKETLKQKQKNKKKTRLK